VQDSESTPAKDRRSTDHLPSRRASPPFGRYQTAVMLGDRGT